MCWDTIDTDCHRIGCSDSWANGDILRSRAIAPSVGDDTRLCCSWVEYGRGQVVSSASETRVNDFTNRGGIRSRRQLHIQATRWAEVHHPLRIGCCFVSCGIPVTVPSPKRSRRSCHSRAKEIELNCANAQCQVKFACWERIDRKPQLPFVGNRVDYKIAPIVRNDWNAVLVKGEAVGKPKLPVVKIAEPSSSHPEIAIQIIFVGEITFIDHQTAPFHWRCRVAGDGHATGTKAFVDNRASIVLTKHPKRI